MNNVFDQYEVWFVTGAQLLYGGDAVIAVDAHSNEMVNGLNESGKLPVKVVYKGTANSSKEVETIFKAANNDEKCIGVITWMHTFSPATVSYTHLVLPCGKRAQTEKRYSSPFLTPIPKKPSLSNPVCLCACPGLERRT